MPAFSGVRSSSPKVDQALQRRDQARGRGAVLATHNGMPYGSNDGYGRQQLRDRPSTTLTDVGRRHMSGSSMSSLLSQGDVVQRGPSPTRHTAPGHAPPDCRSPSLYPSTEEGVHAPVQLPHGASRQDLLSALEQANATIRQLRLELRAATRCGSAHDMGLQCEQLEAEQRELVRAFDDLSRVNGNLRRQLKQQARALLAMHPPHTRRAWPCAHHAATRQRRRARRSCYARRCYGRSETGSSGPPEPRRPPRPPSTPRTRWPRGSRAR